VADDVRALGQYLTLPMLWERTYPTTDLGNSVRTLAAVCQTWRGWRRRRLALLMTRGGLRGRGEQVLLPEPVALQFGFKVGTVQYVHAALLLGVVRMVYGYLPADSRQYTMYLEVCTLCVVGGMTLALTYACTDARSVYWHDAWLAAASVCSHRRRLCECHAGGQVAGRHGRWCGGQARCSVPRTVASSAAHT
jgi:hypothetical protein